MATVTFSVRFDQEEAGALQRLADDTGLDRSACLKQLIRRGLAEVLFDRACEAYRRREATLSRAAEIARLSTRDFLVRMRGAHLEISYDTKALAKDLGS